VFVWAKLRVVIENASRHFEPPRIRGRVRNRGPAATAEAGAISWRSLADRSFIGLDQFATL